MCTLNQMLCLSLPQVHVQQKLHSQIWLSPLYNLYSTVSDQFYSLYDVNLATYCETDVVLIGHFKHEI